MSRPTWIKYFQIIFFKLFFLLCLLLTDSTLYAQESINTNGRTINSASGSVSYTIGQIDYIVWINGNEVSEEGVQHPIETYFVTGIDDYGNSQLNVDVYPIPSSDFIHIRFSNNESGKLAYMLYDLKGSVILQKNACSSNEKIDLQSFSSATYLLKTWCNSKELKTFQIIKK